MGARADAVQTVFTFGVGDHAGAVFHVETHTGNARLARALHPVAVAIGKHRAGDKAAVTEHAAARNHTHRGGVGAEAGGGGRGAVDAIALRRIHAQQGAVSEGDGGAGSDGAGRPHQRRASAAGRVRHGSGHGGRCHQQARRPRHVFETGRQHVAHARARRGRASAIVDTHGVVDKIANLGSGFVGGLGHQQIGTQHCPHLEQRQVVIDHVRVAWRHEKAHEVGLIDRQDRRGIDARRDLIRETAQAGWVNTVERNTASQRGLRRHQRLRHRKRLITGGRGHGQFEQASATGETLTKSRADCRNHILVEAIDAGGLGHCASAADQMNRRVKCSGSASEGLHGQHDLCACNRRASLPVVDDAGRIERQVLLEHSVTRPKRDAQERARHIQLRRVGAEAAGRAGSIRGAAHRTAIDDVAGGITKPDAVGAGNDVAHAVAARRHGGASADNGEGRQVKYFDLPPRQRDVDAGVIGAVVVDILPDQAANASRRTNRASHTRTVIGRAAGRLATTGHGRRVGARDGARRGRQREHARHHPRYYCQLDRRRHTGEGAGLRADGRSRGASHRDAAGGGGAGGVGAGLRTGPARRRDAGDFHPARQRIGHGNRAARILRADVTHLQGVFARAIDGEIARGGCRYFLR